MPAKTPNLYRSRHGVFYLRVCLPETERSNPKSKEVWRSLRTKDPKIAKGLALRFAIEKNYAMPSKSIQSIVDDITKPLTFTSREGHSIDFDPAKPGEADFAKTFIAEHTAKAAQTTEVMRSEDRLRLAETELEFRRKEAEAFHYREALQAQSVQKKSTSEPFSKYIEAYLTLIKNSGLKERTKKAYAAKLAVFQDYVGKSAKLDEITPERLLDFQTWLAKDDPISTRKAITPRSIDDYTDVINNVFKKVVKKLADNPVEGRLVSKKQRMLSNRKPFTPDELRRIFDPVRLNAVINPADFFVPILALLTGSRPASICQLRLGDIRRRDGILVFDYHDYLEGNSSKTTATNRLTPVHPLLEKIGFLRYLEDVRALPDTNATTLIFPWLNQYEQGYADVPSQNFTLLLKRLKIYIHNVKVMYSLRHTTNERMKQCGIGEDFRAQYIGHENDSVNHRTYGGITPEKFLLREVIPHLQFDEIDWSNIRYRSDPEVMQRLVAIAKRRDNAKSTAKKSK